MKKLPAELAKAADEIIADRINAAALQATATGCTADYAIEGQFTWLRSKSPEVWALALLRLEETGNQELLAIVDAENTEN